MYFYDLISPGYDFFLQRLYRRFREHAFEHLPQKTGWTVLDLACGTGLNFSYLAPCVGMHGTIIGLDRSSGMLRHARQALNRHHMESFLLRYDARAISPDILERETKRRSVDMVVCTFGFSAMRDWRIPFHRSFDLLKPGGRFLILDVHAPKSTMHVRMVERFTRSHFAYESWHILEQRCADFHMEYIDPSKYLFGGRVFIASGTKPLHSR